jgi:putative transcriptional regulator
MSRTAQAALGCAGARETRRRPPDLLLGTRESDVLHAVSLRKERAKGLDIATTESSGQARSGGIQMKDVAFQELLTSIKQAGKIRRGRLKPARVTTFRPTDVKSIRETLNASQNEFALMIGVSVATLRNWEQGRRRPDGPALALLRVAARNPRAVAEALHRGAA